MAARKKKSSWGKCKRCAKGVANRWSADGGVCYKCWKELGKPVKPGPVEPVLDEGVPEELAAIRAANRWAWTELPKNPLVETWVTIRRKHPKEFKLSLERLEREYGASKGPTSGGGGVGERVEDETGKRVVGEIEVWLDRARASAESGEKEIGNASRVV